MHLDDRAIQSHRFDLDPHELVMLQFLEQAIQHAGLGPAVHACIDRAPIAELLGQAAPLAAILRDVQDCVEHLKVGERDIPTLYRQERLDPTELRRGDFHLSWDITQINEC